MNTQILLMSIALAAFCAGGLVWLWLQVRKFDRKYGHTYTRPPEN